MYKGSSLANKLGYMPEINLFSTAVKSKIKNGGIFMELDVSIDNESLSIPIGNPFRIDTDAVVEKITEFAALKGTAIDNLDIRGLLPGMVRGISGCEDGCPANALGLVADGYNNFKLAYIEGGILTANAVTENGKTISLKMFPDF
jgi:hypothetical protein